MVWLVMQLWTPWDTKCNICRWIHHYKNVQRYICPKKCNHILARWSRLRNPGCNTSVPAGFLQSFLHGNQAQGHYFWWWEIIRTVRFSSCKVYMEFRASGFPLWALAVDRLLWGYRFTLINSSAAFPNRQLLYVFLVGIHAICHLSLRLTVVHWPL